MRCTVDGPAPDRLTRRFGDRGTASVELVLLVVPVMAVLAFTVFVGRYAATKQELTSASRDAARAAALRQSPDAAREAAHVAATATLADRGVSCPTPTIEIDVDDLVPGGNVTATVTCVIGIGDIAGFGLPGSTTVESTSVAVVDTHRGGE